MIESEDALPIKIAQNAYGLLQGILPGYSHPTSPHRFTMAQIAACLLLKRQLQLSYRALETLLVAREDVRSVLALTEVPDHSTLSRAAKRFAKGNSERPNNPQPPIAGKNKPVTPGTRDNSTVVSGSSGCPYCHDQSKQVKAGLNRSGSQRWHCNVCKRRYTALGKHKSYDKAMRQQVIYYYYHDKMSRRQIAMRMHLSRQTVANWIKSSGSVWYLSP